MNDTAIVTIKTDTELGVAFMDDPQDVSFLDEPDIVAPAGRILRVLLEIAASRLRDAGHYVVHAKVNGHWRPVNELMDDDNYDPDALLWTLARLNPGLGGKDLGRRVAMELDPTPEYLVKLARRRTVMGTTQLGWVDPPGSLGYEDDKIVRQIGLHLGVRLDWIWWIEPTDGRKQPMLCFRCEQGVAKVPLRSVRGQTPVFRGSLLFYSGVVPRKVRRGDWDLILATMGVIVGHDVLGDEGWARVRAAAAKAATTTPVV